MNTMEVNGVNADIQKQNNSVVLQMRFQNNPQIFSFD